MDTRIASVVPLFVFAACHKTVASAPPPTVEVAEVLQSDIKIHRQWVCDPGRIRKRRHPSPGRGYVRKQAYRDGAYVQAGDVLFLIDPRNYQPRWIMRSRRLRETSRPWGKRGST